MQAAWLATDNQLAYSYSFIDLKRSIQHPELTFEMGDLEHVNPPLQQESKNKGKTKLGIK